MYNRHSISPLSKGLETDVKPFLIPDDAYARLQNAYLFRGRLRKRFGSLWLGDTQLSTRLRLALPGVVAGDGTFASAATPGARGAIGQAFSVGTTLLTVYQAAGAMYTTGTATGTYNIATQALTIAGATPGATVYYYPSEPVMGLITFEKGDINNLPVYAFDRQFAYQYIGGAGWIRLGADPGIWTGTDADFFWGATWRGTASNDTLLFVTNFTDTDRIKHWGTGSPNVWVNFEPVLDSTGNTLKTARIILPFKNRLLAFNTKEGIAAPFTNYFNRVRFSQNGSPLQLDAWREDTPGKGGWIDCPVKQRVISVEILKDRCIAFFEQSTWELVYTGNEILPFRWQQINSELGVESTFSPILFDKAILGVGNVGIHACNGANVERIDNKIPDTIYEIHNKNDGVLRVHGIRDYFTEAVYWTLPANKQLSLAVDAKFPNRVLVFNYRTDTWAFNDDSITAFGYYRPATDRTWGGSFMTWGEANFIWGAPSTQSQFRKIIAGNQQGWTFTIEPTISSNSPALQITNISFALTSIATLTCIDHNLAEGDFVLLNGLIGTASAVNNSIFKVETVPTKDTFTFFTVITSGIYNGGGTIARVSRIDILTKQYNFYASQGKNTYLAKVDFNVDRTENGALTVDYYVSTSSSDMIDEGTASGAILGTGNLSTAPYTSIPFEATQTRLWHPIYFQAEGDCVQLRIYYNDTQMYNVNNVTENFELNAFVMYSMPVSRLQ